MKHSFYICKGKENLKWTRLLRSFFTKSWTSFQKHKAFSRKCPALLYVIMKYFSNNSGRFGEKALRFWKNKLILRRFYSLSDGKTCIFLLPARSLLCKSYRGWHRRRRCLVLRTGMLWKHCWMRSIPTISLTCGRVAKWASATSMPAAWWSLNSHTPTSAPWHHSLLHRLFLTCAVICMSASMARRVLPQPSSATWIRCDLLYTSKRSSMLSLLINNIT